MRPIKVPGFELALWAGAALLALSASSCKKSSPAAEGEGEPATASSSAAVTAREETPPEPEAVKDGPPPSIAARSFVFLPNFVTTRGPLNAGKAVPVRAPTAPNGVVVLSCLHIFGPMGGLPEQLTASALPGAVQQAFLLDLDGKKFDIGPALLVADAKPFEQQDASGDVSVFRAPAELASRALELAAGLPKKGEQVWLVSSLVSGSAELMHPARVYYAADKALSYKFDSADLELRATSGAPVVNGKGQIVALNLGGGNNQGELFGFGIPVTSLRHALSEALSAPPK
ncbi:MAG TPA: hypothetical protein VNN80_06055 [Polyangiaceae bacterium]|jgi:hypothetical protein|nr:hypothetical protein [Polyangiaceae bacterium]